LHRLGPSPSSQCVPQGSQEREPSLARELPDVGIPGEAMMDVDQDDGDGDRPLTPMTTVDALNAAAMAVNGGRTDSENFNSADKATISYYDSCSVLNKWVDDSSDEEDEVLALSPELTSDGGALGVHLNPDSEFRYLQV
jgi:hypothetical protein